MHIVGQDAGTMDNSQNLFKPKFTLKDVKISEKKRVYKGFFAIDQYVLTYPRFDGLEMKPLRREIFERDHDAVAILPYDPSTDEVLLIEQFRPGALSDPDSPWLIEVVAGMIDEGETPEQAAVRELKEEAGLSIKSQDLIKICAQYPSPGGASECTVLYLAKTSLAHIGNHGGLASENEDIRVFKAKAEYAFRECFNGRIHNAAALITLMHLQLHHVEYHTK